MCPTAAMTPRRLQGRRWAMMNAEVVLTWFFHMFTPYLWIICLGKPWLFHMLFYVSPPRTTINWCRDLSGDVRRRCGLIPPSRIMWGFPFRHRATPSHHPAIERWGYILIITIWGYPRDCGNPHTYEHPLLHWTEPAAFVEDVCFLMFPVMNPVGLGPQSMANRSRNSPGYGVSSTACPACFEFAKKNGGYSNWWWFFPTGENYDDRLGLFETCPFFDSPLNMTCLLIWCVLYKLTPVICSSWGFDVLSFWAEKVRKLANTNKDKIDRFDIQWHQDNNKIPN